MFSSVGLRPVFALVERRYMDRVLAENQLSSQFSEDGSPIPPISSFSLCSLVQSVRHLHPFLLRTYLLRFHNCLIDMYLITCLIHLIKHTIQLVFI